MKKKKILKTTLIVLLCAAVAAGGTFGALRYARSSSASVNVYPVSAFSTSAEWMENSETEGLVSSDRVQSVYLSATQLVTEIYVEEGQEIHEGDPVLAFDTTLSELELERQEIKIRQLKLDIADAEEKLREIGTYRVGSPSVYTPVYTFAENEPAPYMPYLRTPDARGTAEEPLVWLWNDDCTLDESFFLLASVIAAANREAAKEPTDEPAETAGPEQTEAPEETAPPEETAQPAQTEKPVSTAEPAETETPAQTQAPEETEPPEGSDAPAEADAPEETEPTAAPADETQAEPTVPGSEPVGEEDEQIPDESAAAPALGSRLLSMARGHTRLLTAGEEEAAEPVPDEDPYLYIVFEVREGDAPEGALERVWEMALYVEETLDWSARFIAPSYDPGDDGGESYDDFSYDTNVYYSAAEIAQMKGEEERKLQALRIELKSAELDYDRLSYELSNGEVLSRIDGVVKTVRTPDEARAEDRPVVMISGGGGYYVTAVLGELDLGTMHVGDPVTVMSWETYEQLEGTITEISEYPDESGRYWFYSEGNQNVSVYPFTVFIDEEAELRDGAYVSVSYSSSPAADGSLYLEMPFVRQENGQSWVYVTGADGLLEKRTVTTGKNLWGSYIQILSGLSEDDLIAFPYGRQTTEGAKTQRAEAEELWASAYGYG